MSEILGEARILIRPDITGFRAQLEEQLAFAKKPIVVPVVATAAGAGSAVVGKLTAEQKLFTQATLQLNAALDAGDLALKGSITEQDALAVATKASVTTSRALQAAIISQNSALIEQSAAMAAAARSRVAFLSGGSSQGALAGAVATTNKNLKEEGAAFGATARQQSQFERGAVRTTLSQFGLAGATLTASGAFIAAAAGTLALIRAYKASTDNAEQLALATERLRESVDAVTNTRIQAWAAGLATSFGVSRVEAIQFVGALEATFKNFGVGTQQATQFSEELTKVAANVAIVAHVPVSQVFTAIQRGLAGNGRALRVFQIFVDQSRVAQEALNDTGKKQISTLTRQELILARYNIILRDSADRQHAFAQESQSASGQAAILSANFSNLATSAGGPLNRALSFTEKVLNGIFIEAGKAQKAIHDLKQEGDKKPARGGVLGFLESTGGQVATGVLAQWKFAIDGLLKPFRDLADIEAAANKNQDNVAESSKRVGAAMRDATGQVRGLSDGMGVLASSTIQATLALKEAQSQAGKIAAKTLREQAASPTGDLTPQQQIAQSTADIAAQRKIVAASRSSSKDRTDALKRIAQDKRDRTNAQKQIASDAVDQANQAKTAAQKAQDASDAADQAIIRSISGGETRLTDQLILAGPKKTIAIDKQIVQFFKDAIKRVRETVKNAQTAADEISALTTGLLNAVKQLKDDQAARDQAIAEAVQSAADARAQHLDAILSIAETTTGTGDDRAAINARIRFDKAQIARINDIKHKRKLTQDEKAQLDAYRVDLAQREQALRNLIGQQKKNTRSQAEFNFLQTQTGFVSNLLGNLIPGGATAGLVGGGGGPSVPSNVRPTGQLSAAQTTSQANLVRGVSAGQAETQTFWLKQIAKILKDMHQGDAHPEAHKQRRTGAAVMDFQSATPGF